MINALFPDAPSLVRDLGQPADPADMGLWPREWARDEFLSGAEVLDRAHFDSVARLAKHAFAALLAFPLVSFAARLTKSERFNAPDTAKAQDLQSAAQVPPT